METRAERRLRKLVGLVEKYKAEGGHTYIAEESGLTPNALDMVLKGSLLPMKADGTRSPRSLGDPAVKAIEDNFKLGRGWFDSDDQAQTQAIAEKPVGLSAYALKLAEALDRITDLEAHARAFTAAMDAINGRAGAQPAAEAVEASGDPHRKRSAAG